MKKFDLVKLMKNDKGAVLVYTLLTMLVIAVVCVSFTMLSMNAYRTTALSASKAQSFLYAKSVGQAFAVQLVKDYEATNIIDYLESNSNRAAVVNGRASIKFNHAQNSAYANLTDINITEASVKFYFKVTCANCGRRLEEVEVCPNCNHTEKNVDKTYLYVDVGVSYGGATEIVTSVFTYLDKTDFEQTMYDLFSVYNIYSTSPGKMTFNINSVANAADGAEDPDVYLYNGTDETGYSDGTITYRVSTDLKANLTSTGDVTVDSQGTTRQKVGSSSTNFLTSYGKITLARIEVANVISRGNVELLQNALVDYDINCRSKVKITGSGKTVKSCNDIYAMGDIQLSNCQVNNVYGGADSNITLLNCTVGGKIVTGGSITIGGGCTFNGSVNAGKNLKVTFAGSNSDNLFKSTVVVGGDLQLGFNNTVQTTFKNRVDVNGSIKVGGSVGSPATRYSKPVLFEKTSYINNYDNNNLDTGDNMFLQFGSGASLYILTGATKEGYNSTQLGGIKAGTVVLGTLNGGSQSTTIAPAFSMKAEINNLFFARDKAHFYQGEAVVNEENANTYNKAGTFGENVYEVFTIDCKGSIFSAIYLNNSQSGTEKGNLCIKNATITGSVAFEKGIFYDTILGSDTAIEKHFVANNYAILAGSTVLKSNSVLSEESTARKGQESSGIDNGFVEVKANVKLENNSLLQTRGECYFNGIAEGKIVVGSPSSTSKLRIKSHARLNNVVSGQDIYVYGQLYVDYVLNSEKTNRILIKDNVGPTIFVDGASEWSAEIYGPIYNLYAYNSAGLNIEEPAASIYAKKPYILGSSIQSVDYVRIDSKGFSADIQSMGSKLVQETAIVYVAETPANNINIDDLMLAGTIVIRKGVSFKLKSLYTADIIGDAELAVDATGAKVREYVNAHKTENTTVTSLTTTGDFQLDYSGTKRITFKNCVFHGWFRAERVSTGVTFDNTIVQGDKWTNYADDPNTALNESKNLSTGCVYTKGTFIMTNKSAIGGTFTTQPNVTQNKGGLYCADTVQMINSKVWGDVSCAKIDKMESSAYIKGNVVMSATASLTWEDATIDAGSLQAPNISLTYKKGTLGKSGATSSNYSANDSNKYFVNLAALDCQNNNAYVGAYYNLYLTKSSTICFANLGNVNFDAGTSATLTIRKPASGNNIINGRLYCSGKLACMTTTPRVVGGLYVYDLDSSATDFSKTAITGNVVINQNYTGAVTLQTSGASVNAKGANVTVTKVTSNTQFDVKNLTLETTGGAVGKIKVAENLLIKNKTTQLNVNGDVSANSVVVNLTNVSSYKSINSSYTPCTSNAKVYFAYKLDSLTSVYLRNAEVRGTLTANNGVYAYSASFYGTGYSSNVNHCTYDSSLNTANGSIRCMLNTTGFSGTYNTYFQSCYFYSNILVYSGSATNYFTGCTLGVNITGSDVNNANASKVYSFNSSVTLVSTNVRGVHSNSVASPAATVKFEVCSGNLTIDASSHIGYYSGTNREDPFGGDTRPNEHTGYDGIYVGGNITNNGWITVNIRRCSALTNNGAIAYQKVTTRQFEKTFAGIGHKYQSKEACGGYITCTSYTGSGYNSMTNNVQGHREYFTWWGSGNWGDWSNDNKHFIGNDEKSTCNHNNDNFKKSSSGSSTGYYNKFTSRSVTTVAGLSTSYSSIKLTGTKTVNLDYVGVEILTDTTIGEMQYYQDGKASKPNYIVSNSATINGAAVNGLTDAAKLRLNVGNRTYWKPMAIPLRWYQPTKTTAGEAVKLNTHTNNELTVYEKKLGKSFDALRNMKKAWDNITEVDWWKFWEWGKIRENLAVIIDNIGPFFANLNTAFMPSTEYLGLKFNNQTDALYRRISANNINTVLSEKGNSDVMIITRNVIIANSFFPSNEVVDALNKISGGWWKPEWKLPVSWSFNTRPVALAFFESGLVPANVFSGTTYRTYDKESTEKDNNGRWYWGGGQDNVWYGLSTPVNDVNWVFFTCEDPKNPYTSKAKDLHIVLPKGVKMNWTKDKNNCVSIIGNGRVFLYVQDDSDIKIVGNGFANWLSDEVFNSGSGISNWINGIVDANYNVFGGWRYVGTERNQYGEYVTKYDNNGKILLDEAAKNSGNYERQPRMYIVGTGGNIRFEVCDFQTAAYVYMPSGNTYYSATSGNENEFIVSSEKNQGGVSRWDIIGMYVCDIFTNQNNTNASVRYIRTSPDLSTTTFKYGKTVLNTTHNGGVYSLSEFWDYPPDLPVSSMNWYYRGVALQNQ